MVKNRPATINWDCLNKCYVQTFEGTMVRDLLNPFDSRYLTLWNMQTGWDGEAYTFPVRNANDEIIGITRRWPDGTKGMVKGSQVGIYIPRISFDPLPDEWCLFICEGASDTATALDMGLRVIGRVSCQTGKDHIIRFCLSRDPAQIVIVADNDSAGITGAKILSTDITQAYNRVGGGVPKILVYLPGDNSKDLREYVQNGGTTAEFLQSVQNLLDF